MPVNYNGSMYNIIKYYRGVSEGFNDIYSHLKRYIKLSNFPDTPCSAVPIHKRFWNNLH